jgi:hypothetical protein
VLPRLLLRRLGPLGVALTVYDVWRHVPEKRREQLIELARTQGTRAASYVEAKGTVQLRKWRD